MQRRVETQIALDGEVQIERRLLEDDAEVDNAVLDDAFDLRRSLRNLPHVLDQVEHIEL